MIHFACLQIMRVQVATHKMATPWQIVHRIANNDGNMVVLRYVSRHILSITQQSRYTIRTRYQFVQEMITLLSWRH